MVVLVSLCNKMSLSNVVHPFSLWYLTRIDVKRLHAWIMCGSAHLQTSFVMAQVRNAFSERCFGAYSHRNAHEALTLKTLGWQIGRTSLISKLKKSPCLCPHPKPRALMRFTSVLDKLSLVHYSSSSHWTTLTKSHRKGGAPVTTFLVLTPNFSDRRIALSSPCRTLRLTCRRRWFLLLWRGCCRWSGRSHTPMTCPLACP